MKNKLIDDLLKKKATELVNLLNDDDPISQHQFLEISVFLFHYSKYTNNAFYKAAAEQSLSLALCDPLDRNYTLLDGVAAFGLGLEHLKENNFIYDDIDEILKDIDVDIYSSIINLNQIDLSNRVDVLSMLHYFLNRGKLSKSNEEITDKLIFLFVDHYNNYYKGFLFGNNSSSIYIELACFNTLVVFQKQTGNQDLLLLIDWIMNSILYYIFNGQNSINVFNAKLLYSLLKASEVLQNQSHKEKIEICFNNYLTFLDKESHLIFYPKHINICNGLGSMLYDHILLNSFKPKCRILDQFIDKIHIKIENLDHGDLRKKTQRDHSHISFINSDASSGYIYIERQQSNFLLKLNRLLML